MNNLRENRNFIFLVFAVMILSLSVIYTTGATTIGNNVSVTGTLTSTGNATLSGTLAVTGTSDFTGATTFAGNNTFGNAAADVNLFTGTLQASTTALFTSGFTTYGDWSINKTSETAVSFGSAGINFDSNTLVIDPTNNRVGVGSSTPITEFGVQSAATTTISVGSSGTNSGGCIQLKGTNGVNFRIFATASSSVTKQLHVEEGACK